METYRDTTRTNLLILHTGSPINHPLFNMNCTISGIPNNMINKSATARFIINTFVTEFLIFLSTNMTTMTRPFPKIPMNPMTINKRESNPITSGVAGSGWDMFPVSVSIVPFNAFKYVTWSGVLSLSFLIILTSFSDVVMMVLVEYIPSYRLVTFIIFFCKGDEQLLQVLHCTRHSNTISLTLSMLDL